MTTREQNRRAFLKLAYHCGKHDGLHAALALNRYQGDEEAQMRYRIGVKVGQKLREKVRHED